MGGRVEIFNVRFIRKSVRWRLIESGKRGQRPETVSATAFRMAQCRPGGLRYKGPEFIGARSISQDFGLSSRHVMARTSSKVSRALPPSLNAVADRCPCISDPTLFRMNLTFNVERSHPPARG